MTGRPLEPRLHSIIGEIARGPYPDYIDDVLAGTARTRQRPPWTFPERWLGMDIAAQPLRPTRRVPTLGLAVVALLVIALLGALVVATGGPRLPPIYGRAANGLVTFAFVGDIVTVDPVTGTATTVVAGPEIDREPVVSPDGTRIAFGRDDKLAVARIDGTGLVTLSPTALSLTNWRFSPDGRSIAAIAVGEGKTQVLIVPSDGSASPRVIDVGLQMDYTRIQYRPDGSEIMLYGVPAGGRFGGVYALDPRTERLRTIVTGTVDASVLDASLSPDGTRIAYNLVDSRVLADGNFFSSSRTHIIGIDGTGDRPLEREPGVHAIFAGTWSNDGTRLLALEVMTPDGRIGRSAIVPVDGTAEHVVIDCRPGGSPTGDCSGNWELWSPDDSLVVGTAVDGTIHLTVDTSTGKVRNAPWTGSGAGVSWQRRALGG